jgi:16S rRNA (guanine527-N7)-methyltransferase
VDRRNSRPDAVATLTSAEIAAGARELGLQLTDDQAGRLARYAALLVRWNSVHNLTAISSPGSILSHHLLDSLAVLAPIDVICAESGTSLLDIGSGGGLPGIPLAIARPQWHVTLVDKVQKKVAFLMQARLELGLLNVDCVHARVEALQGPRFDVIVSRAFSSLVDFVEVSRHLLAPGGWWAAMKGTHPTAELDDLQSRAPDVRVVDVVKLHVPRVGAERHLILLQCP